MLQFRGFGLVLVCTIYFTGLFWMSRAVSYFGVKEKEQYIILIAFHIFVSCINYFLARFLNRKEVKHTVFELRLEVVVLFVAILLSFLLIFMVKGILY